jgi:glycerophosphoryl diester phosphodiesterase
VDEPKPYAWERLAKVGVEPAFGTLGRKGERLDDQYLADGDASEYDALARQGLVLLATDEPYRVADLIKADDVGRKACGR